MSSSTLRPYAASSISQLEELFDASNHQGSEPHQALLHELSHRKTSRARRLLWKVQQGLPNRSTFPVQVEQSNATLSGGSKKPQRSLEGAGSDKPGNDYVAPKLAAQCPPPSLPAKPFPTPNSRDEPASIIAAWIALEALSPATYNVPHDLVNDDRSRVGRLDGGSLPWNSNARSRPGYQLYYRVVLGSVLMDTATEALVKIFSDDEARIRTSKKKAVAAEIILDRYGVPLTENAVSISSFAWALPLALSRRFGELSSWPEVEESLQDGIEGLVQRADPDGKPLPLDLPTLEKAYHWLVGQCAIPGEMIERPTFALRHFHPFKAKTQPEPMLLNSFFLHDLARAARHLQDKTAPKSVLQYLGTIEKPISLDILKDQRLLEEAVSPRLIPPAKWPKDGQALVMLQQAAVNLARRELRGEQGLFAVNGMPGLFCTS
jgi:hypothetical protein